MRLSPQRHTLALLRIAIGLTQKEMAELAECSRPTIQAVELGKLALSQKLGVMLARKTGVSLSWLMAGDVTRPPVTEQGEPYDKATYEAYRALGVNDLNPDLKPMDLFRILSANLQRLEAVCLRGYKDSKLSLFAYRLSSCFDELEQVCGVVEEDYRDAVLDEAPAMLSAENRKAGKETAKMLMPCLTPLFATIHADNLLQRGNLTLRADIWEKISKVTAKFSVAGEYQSDGRTVYKLKRRVAPGSPGSPPSTPDHTANPPPNKEGAEPSPKRPARGKR